MPRYYFHTVDGGQAGDSDGVELPDIEAAKIQASRFLAELVDDDPRLLQTRAGLRVVVTDGAGQEHFSVDASLKARH